LSRLQLHLVTKLLALYVVVFLARTLWSITYSADVNVLQARWLSVLPAILSLTHTAQTQLNKLQKKDDLTHYYFWVFIFFTVFEIVPSTFLLLAFGHWSTRKVARMELGQSLSGLISCLVSPCQPLSLLRFCKLIDALISCL
jgi:hypothetical protein